MIVKYKKKNYEKWPSYSLKEANDVKQAIIKSNLNYWTGKETLKFEKKFSNFFGLKYALAISNASTGLDIAIKALNIQKNDEVIVSPKSYYSSVSCIIKNKAKPIFIDVNLNSHCFDENKIEEKITNKTKLILCVHLGGFPCNMKKIKKIAKKYNLFILEDCSQAHGAMIGNKFVGTFGDISVWSFCNDKIISTGEGGVISSNKKKLFKKIWSLKENGRDYDAVYSKKHKFGYKWIHNHLGYNYRMTEMQAILGLNQLNKLNKNISIRNYFYQQIIKNYENFEAVKFQKIPKSYTNSFYRLYAIVNLNFIKSEWDRDRLIKYLNKIGIDCNVGSCSELYKEKGIKKYFKNNHILPNAEILSKNSIAFNIHHKCSEKYIEFVWKSLNKTIKKISK